MFSVLYSLLSESHYWVLLKAHSADLDVQADLQSSHLNNVGARPITTKSLHNVLFVTFYICTVHSLIAVVFRLISVCKYL